LFDELLLPAAKRGVQVTIVDNASEVHVKQFLNQFIKIDNVEIILNDENLGVAKGRNTGFTRSNREFIVYLDDDALMALAAIKQIPSLFAELPNAGILSFCVVHGVTGDAQQAHSEERMAVGNFHGAGHAIRRALFNRVGYLDESCFFGAEEIEFSMRALASGMQTIYTSEIIVRHFSRQQAGKQRVQRRINWARNYAMVLFRYLPVAKAFLFNGRLLVSYVLSGCTGFTVGVAYLPFAIMQGAIKGLRTRNLLNAEGVAFYSNPNTRPELGNVSLASKVWCRLSHHKKGSGLERITPSGQA
jgi:GT2 family glycosyltransferase